ncbi:MAG: hypothetical protein GXX79_06755 [Actinomycetales bacterium]|nr:hypothetical protein [Actinomycetales bacterium]
MNAHVGHNVATLGADFALVKVGTSKTLPAAYAAGDNLYVGAGTPGSYTFRVFQDHNGNGAYESDMDDATQAFSLTVKDVTGATASETDDLDFVVSAPTSIGLGFPLTTTSTPSLTFTDTRGANGATGYGKLGEALATAMRFTYLGGGVPGTETPSFNGTLFTFTTAAATTAGALTTQPKLDKDGAATYYTPTAQLATTTVVDNGVTGMSAVEVEEVEGSVLAGVGTATIKPATASTTYSVTVTDAGTKTDDTVYFTLVPGTNTPVLTGDGTFISDTSGTKVYSVTADADGVAEITVTSSVTTNGTTFTVDAMSNNKNVDLVTSTYTTPSAKTFALTTDEASLYPTVGTESIALAGTLKDQYGSAFQPAPSADQQVTVTADTARDDCDYDAGGTDTYATLTAGAFSSTYTAAAGAAAGKCDVIRFAYAGATSYDVVLRWTSSEAAAAITIAKPNDNAIGVNLSDSQDAPGAATAIAVGQAAGGATDFGDSDGQISATVKDATGNALAYKPVTITGSEGVYFSTAAAGTDLETTIEKVSTDAGVVTGVYAFFTKSGTATVTFTSGAASATATMTTDVSDDAYVVTVDDVTADPGSTVIVTGTVADAFGNVVQNSTVNLSLGASTLGTLGDSAPATNSEGVFSTTFLAGSNQNGEATLTATLNGQTQNKTADAVWLATGKLTIADGDYQDTATVTVSPEELTIVAPATRSGAGTVTLTGTAKPSTSVKIYAQATGTSDAYGLVKTVTSDAEGAWTASVIISKSMTFIAETTTATSDEAATEIITMEAIPQRTNSGATTLSGVAVPGSTVTIRKKVYGTSTWSTVGTVTADETTGAYSKAVWVAKYTSYAAKTTVATSPIRAAKVKAVVVWSGDKAKGGGKYLLRADGAPNLAGTLTFYQKSGSTWVKIKDVATGTYGTGSYTWSTTKGAKTVKVTFVAPGLVKSAAVTKSITVT